MLERGANGSRRDLVEHYSEDMISVQLGSLLSLARLLFLFLARPIRAVLRGHGGLQNFRQVRADRFAFTVRVGGQIDRLGLLRRFLESLHDVRLLGTDFVRWLEAALDIDAQFFLGQVHHVAVRRLDRVIAAEIFVDRLRLGRRFDDDQ